MSAKNKLSESEKVAVRLSIKAALHVRGTRGYQRAHYSGVLDGIGLVARNLGYARNVVLRKRQFDRLMKALEKA
jgi:hypothetical protein